MLKWFKTLKNRLFSDEDEINDEIENVEDEIINDNDQGEQIKPVFRFPIITDAEIYGWDEDEMETEYPKEVEATSNKELDDFEPIPLYKNERWPVNQEKVIVHRANPSFTREREQEQEQEQEQESYTLRASEEIETSKVNTRNLSERFVPSKVPSPIYGYSVTERKERKVAFEEETVNNIFGETESILDRNEEVDERLVNHHEFQNEVDDYLHDELEEHPSTIEQDRVDEQLEETNGVEASVEIVTETDAKESEIETSIQEDDNVEQPITMPSVKLEEEFETHNEQDLQPVVEVAVAIEEDVAENVQTEVANLQNHEQFNEVIQEVETQQTIIVEEPIAEEIDQASDEEDNLQLSDRQTLPDLFNKEEEPIVEVEEVAVEEVVEEKEKVVPFNVLMLKSDKEKLRKREILKETIVAPVKPKVQIEKKEEVVVEEEKQSSQFENYAFPSMDYLIPPETEIEDTAWLTAQSEKLEESLSHFGVQAKVIDAVQGPTVTRFELTVEQGTKVSRIRNLNDDLKLTLAARDIRIQAPIPGKSSIGIEIPNRKTRAVRISEVIQTDAFKKSESPMEAVLGLGLTGNPVTLDLRKMPHGMIAGATGSGKSVCINSILVSLLYKASPADLQMMLIDPKMVELAPFNGIPHLISPVITDIKAATAALKWAVAEMERRYELLAHAGVRDIERYNKQVNDNRQFSLKMPYLLIVIDELADLMMVAPSDVEVSISRIAQKARACGIHLIIATQRPSVDVITGIIKANIPTRIAFSVSSQVDSRTMLDTNGAERLLGKGDMLYVGNGESSSVRLQGTFVTDDEIERIIEHVQNEASPTYLFGQDDLLKSAGEEDEDPLFTEACVFIYEQDSASTSMLQRNFSIGYNRAAKLMDRMEKYGFISPQQGSRARDVYLTESDIDKLKETVL